VLGVGANAQERAGENAMIPGEKEVRGNKKHPTRAQVYEPNITHTAAS